MANITTAIYIDRQSANAEVETRDRNVKDRLGKMGFMPYNSDDDGVDSYEVPKEIVRFSNKSAEARARRSTMTDEERAAVRARLQAGKERKAAELAELEAANKPKTVSKAKTATAPAPTPIKAKSTRPAPAAEVDEDDIPFEDEDDEEEEDEELIPTPVRRVTPSAKTPARSVSRR